MIRRTLAMIDHHTPTGILAALALSLALSLVLTGLLAWWARDYTPRQGDTGPLVARGASDGQTNP